MQKEIPAAADEVAAAIRKFPCSACGAEVLWAPGAAVLLCPYCGTRQEVAPADEIVVERALADGLAAPRDLGWGAARKTVRCTRCGATESLDPGLAATSCAFCGTATIVDTPADPLMVRPEGIVPFAIDQRNALTRFRDWIGKLWFRPGDLRQKATVDSLRGVYIPFWTFDAETHSVWRAEAGFHENVRRGSSTERRTRWEWRQGVLEKAFDDVPVPASRGLQPLETRPIEPFPTADLTPFDPRYLPGFVAEEVGVDLEHGWAFAKQRMQLEVRAACAAAVPGDTHRNLQVQTEFSEVGYKGALLPVWIAAYQYGGKTYRFLVNGATGKVAGKAPVSWPKILIAVGTVLLLLLIFANL